MKRIKNHQYAKLCRPKGRASHYWAFNYTFEENFYLIVGQKKKVLEEYPEYEKHLEKDGFCSVSANDKGIMIWISERGLLDSFVHECTHALVFLMDRKGLEFDVENDEQMAYLMSWLFRTFYFAVK